METVKALEKAENRIAEKVFTQANKKYLRSGHTINKAFGVMDSK